MKSRMNWLGSVPFYLLVIILLCSHTLFAEQADTLEAKIAKFDYGTFDGGGRVLNDDAIAEVVKEGSLAIPGLLKGLKHQKYTVRWGSAKALAKLSVKSPQVIAGIAALTNDEEWLVRRAALEALVSLDSWDESTIKALNKFALDMESPKVARRMYRPPFLSSGMALGEDTYIWDNSKRAIKTLSSIGRKALPTLNALKKQLRGERLAQVEEAIKKVGSK